MYKNIKGSPRVSTRRIMIYPPYPCERRFIVEGGIMKQIDNLLECTKALHTALVHKTQLASSCQALMASIKEVEAIGGFNLLAEDRSKLMEILILSEENRQLALSQTSEIAGLLEAVKLNHR
jgi:hypothetical protein